MIFINLSPNTEDEHPSGIVKMLFLYERLVQKETERCEVSIKKQPSEGLPYERLTCIPQLPFFFLFFLQKLFLMVHDLNAHCLIIYASRSVFSAFRTFAVVLTFSFHTPESTPCTEHKAVSKGPLESA